MKGRVNALCVSRSKGERKKPVSRATFRIEHGIEGDGHAGPWHRQVSLLDAEDIETVRKKGLPDLAPGDFAENVILSGLDLAFCGLGTTLRLGENVVLSITQIGKECHSRCRIYYLTGDCIMPRLGVFARVEAGGEVVVSDEVEIMRLLPRGTAEVAATTVPVYTEKEIRCD